MSPVAVMLMLASTLASQPAPPARPGTPSGAPAGPALQPPVDVDPRTAFAEIVKAYASAPTRERMEVIAGVGTRADQRRGTLEVELHPGSPPGHADVRAVIDAGPLRVAADGESIRTTMRDYPDTVFVSPTPEGGVTPAALSAALPPLPLPQLSLVRTPAGEAPADLLPWISGVSWTKATLDQAAREGPTLTIEGTLRDGRMAVLANAETGRLRSMSLSRGGTPETTTHIAVNCTPLPLSTSTASADVTDDAGRVEVATLADLSRRLGELVIGSVVRWIGEGSPRVALVRGPGLSEGDERARLGLARAAWAEARTQWGEGTPAELVQAYVSAATPRDAASSPRVVVGAAAARALKGGGLAFVVLDDHAGGLARVRAWIPIAADADAKALGERLAAAAKDAR